MLFNSLVPSPALQLTAFADVDAFRPAELMEDARSIPLDVAHFAAARAVVCLPACRIVLMRSFARILDAAYRAPGGMVILSMSDDVQARANGAELDHRSIIAIRGADDCHFVEPKDNLHAMIILSPDLPDRGCFDTADRVEAFVTERAPLAHARQLIFGILRTAGVEPGLLARPEIAHNLQEGLLLALDDLFRAADHDARGAGERPSKLVQRMDECIAADPTSPIYTADLARELGVSVRTLGGAIAKVRGMSLHRYIRLKKLWATRARLLKGGGGMTVTSCARAHGFHHMGEFAATYRAAFHEVPSETLARGRQVHCARAQR